MTTDDDGEETKAVVVRVDPDGTLDTSFDGDGRFILDFSTLALPYRLGRARGVAIDDAGRILVVGECLDPTNRRPLIFRLTPGGSLDPSFPGGGVSVGAAFGAAHAVAFDREADVVWVLGDASPNLIWTWRWMGIGMRRFTTVGRPAFFQPLSP